MKNPDLNGFLECLCINLIDEADKLPNADMVLANLLIEYIGYECFQKVVKHVNPKYVSCIIQINMGDDWVSDSPYLHIFDGLEQVHHQVEEDALERAMLEIDYHAIRTLEHMLPNGKKLVQRQRSCLLPMRTVPFLTATGHGASIHFPLMTQGCEMVTKRCRLRCLLICILVLIMSFFRRWLWWIKQSARRS